MAARLERFREMTCLCLHGADPIIELSDELRSDMRLHVACGLGSIESSPQEYAVKLVVGTFEVKMLELMGRFAAGQLTDDDLRFKVLAVKKEREEGLLAAAELEDVAGDGAGDGAGEAEGKTRPAVAGGGPAAACGGAHGDDVDVDVDGDYSDESGEDVTAAEIEAMGPEAQAQLRMMLEFNAQQQVALEAEAAGAPASAAASKGGNAGNGCG